MQTDTALSQAIERCYRLFAKYPAPEHLEACTDCCMRPDIEREMRTLPLRSLSARHFWEYNTAAHENGAASTPDIRYLLPRWLELYAADEELGWGIGDLFEGRLGENPRQFFSPEEWQAVEDFARALFDDKLTKYPCPDSNIPLGSLLDTFAQTSINIRPMLDNWLHTNTPEALLHYAVMVRYGYNGVQPERAEPELRNWIEDAACRQIFAERILAAADDFARLSEQQRSKRYGQCWREMLEKLEYAYDWIVY